MSFTYPNATIISVDCTASTQSGNQFKPTLDIFWNNNSTTTGGVVVFPPSPAPLDPPPQNPSATNYNPIAGNVTGINNNTFQQVTWTTNGSSLTEGTLYVASTFDPSYQGAYGLSVPLIYAPVSQLHAWVKNHCLCILWCPPNCGFKPTAYEIDVTTPRGSETKTTSNEFGFRFLLGDSFPTDDSWTVTVRATAMGSRGPKQSIRFDPTTTQPPDPMPVLRELPFPGKLEPVGS